MAGMMEGVDQRTNLVGENRFELLLFGLGGRQKFGINVFKVQEVIQCPPLTTLPHAHSIVRGIAHLRGRTITVLDLAMAIGRKPIQDIKNKYVIIAEYNRTVQGFLVEGVEQIVNLNWQEILPPPKGIGKDNYMTAVTKIGDHLVEIIDVEKVLADLVGIVIDVADGSRVEQADGHAIRVLVADDSLVARKQIKGALDKMNVESELAKNGREALDMLLKAVEDGRLLKDTYDLIISDVEMPEMDGYTLTSAIRADERLSSIPVVLHTSLSGTFNNKMIEKVGADKFIAKFNAAEFSKEIKCVIDELRS